LVMFSAASLDAACRIASSMRRFVMRLKYFEALSNRSAIQLKTSRTTAS
jgi:hypothetical protein